MTDQADPRPGKPVSITGLRQVSARDGRVLLLAESVDGTSFGVYADSLYGDISAFTVRSHHLRSMAFELSDEYALSDHAHDGMYVSSYVSAEDFSLLSPEQVIKFDRLAALSVPVQDTGIGDFALSAMIQTDRKPGQLAFACADTAESSPYNSGFKGWVPANGESYQLSDFYLSSALDILYGISETGRFSVPNIDGWFMKIGTEICGTYLVPQPGQTAVGAHRHPGELDPNASITIEDVKDISVPVQSYFSTVQSGQTPKSGKKQHNTVHHGKTGSKIVPRKASSTSYVIGSIDGQAEPAAAGEGDTYPPYTGVRPMVYVGFSLSSDPLTALAASRSK